MGRSAADPAESLSASGRIGIAGEKAVFTEPGGRDIGKTASGAEATPPALRETESAEDVPDEHHDLYGPQYYQGYETFRADGDGTAPPPYRWGESVWEDLFQHMAEEAVAHLHPRTALDVGCAIGFLVKAMRDKGVDAEGFDSSAWAISQVPEQVRPHCWVGSITEDLSRDYDLITCIEVLEHLLATDAPAAVANLCRHGEAVLFSSTPDHFDEVTHVNVRPPEYWAELFARHGFYRDVDFDAGFVAPHALLFRPIPFPAHVVAGYERWNRHSTRELDGVRSHRDHLHGQIEQLIRDRDHAQAQLRGLMATKTFRLTAGIRALWAQTRVGLASPPAPPRPSVALTYADWVDRYDTLDDGRRQWLEEGLATLRGHPTISVLMPVFDPAAEHLGRAIDSVLAQIYPHWELCIADDASTAPHVRPLLERYRDMDSRIRVEFRSEHGHIARASNTALGMAVGEFVALLDHDDELPAHALACLALELGRYPDAALLYSDEDKLDVRGERCEPYFKPDWNPELFLGQNYLSHLGAYRRDLVVAAGGFRPGFDGSQDYDLAMRISEVVEPRQIRHVPLVLYHWRIHPSSTSGLAQAKPYARSASLRALADHLARVESGSEAVLALGDAGNRVRLPLGVPAPPVSIFVTGDDEDARSRSLRSLRMLTSYPDFTADRAANPWLFRDGADPARDAEELAADASREEVLCVVSAGVEVVDENWLRELVAHLARPGVGMVGARLELPDGTVTMSPVVLGSNGGLLAPLEGLDRLSTGYFGHAWLTRAVGALAPGCFAIRRSVVEETEGVAPRGDQFWRIIDLALRVRQRGYRVLWTPDARLGFVGSVGMPPAGSMPGDLLQQFSELLEQDPSYSGNLSLQRGEAFSPAFPPRRPPHWVLERPAAHPTSF